MILTLDGGKEYLVNEEGVVFALLEPEPEPEPKARPKSKKARADKLEDWFAAHGEAGLAAAVRDEFGAESVGELKAMVAEPEDLELLIPSARNGLVIEHFRPSHCDQRVAFAGRDDRGRLDALWHALTAEGTSGTSPRAPERVDLASLPHPWADGRSSLQIYLASGKLKHARDFWLLPSTQQVSWGKTLRAKKCKTGRLASVVTEPKIRHAKELFEEMDDDQSGYLDDKE